MRVISRGLLLSAICLIMLGTAACTIEASIIDLGSAENKNSQAPSSPAGEKIPVVLIASSLTPVNNDNKASYGISGSCSYVDTIDIKINGTSFGNTTCSAGAAGANGTWTKVVDVSSVLDGNLTIQVVDVSSGSVLANQSVIKDTVVPVAALSSAPTAINNLTLISSGVSTTDTVEYSYKVGLAVSTDCSDGAGYSSFVAVATAISHDVSSLADGNLRLCLIAKDAVGNTQVQSSATIYNWNKETVPPAAPASIEDGDQIVSTSYSSWIAWPAATDAGSGVASYEVRIVDSGNSQVVAWTNVGSALGYGFTGLALTEGQTYKAEVRALDVAGNVSAVTQGNGWYVVPQGWKQQAYLKAPNVDASDMFGSGLAISGDTIVVGAYGESSNQITITNGTTASSNNSANSAGAAYVFKRSGTGWVQEAYLKAPNAGGDDRFGYAVAISEDTIVVGAYNEGSNQITITNGTTASANNSALASGAVYVFKRTGTTWAQEAYIKPPNTGAGDHFGWSVAISGDTIVAGANNEGSNQTTITNGTTASADNSATFAGAAYVFKRTGVNWAQQAYLKAPNMGMFDVLGSSVAISGDTIVVGAYGESSNQTTITNGTTASADNSAAGAGAAYVFKRTGVNWAQQAYLKPPNTGTGDNFGNSVAIAGDVIVVGAEKEDSNQMTITNGTTASSDNSAADAGAAYVFRRTGTAWAQEAYLKPSNIEAGDQFGGSVAISGDSIIVGAYFEDSNQTTITNGSAASSNNSAADAGAAYVFKRTGTAWAQEAYLKAPNVDAGDYFGWKVGASENTLVVSAVVEASNQTTITNGATASSDNSLPYAGAVYVYTVDRPAAWSQQAYVKAPNAEASDFFGVSLAISGDTLVVGASSEDSNQITITNGATASSDNSAIDSGAAYVFKRTGTAWAQEAYLKAPNAEASDLFGGSVAISGDTIVVGARNESSSQTTITNGTTASSNNTAVASGAAYVFKRTGTTWAQEAYLKAPNTESNDQFGYSVAISGDSVVVGATWESSSQTTITNGTTASADNSASLSGAVYVFKRTGTSWAQEAYIKSPNTEAGDFLGYSVAISGDTLVAGAPYESSSQTTITNGTTASSDNSASEAGATYVFKRTGVNWAQEAYLKAPNALTGNHFGWRVDVSGDTVIASATAEDSNQTTITNGTTASSNTSATSAGAVHVFKRTGTTWAQEAYLKPPNIQSLEQFGYYLAISGDTIAVASPGEDSNQITITNGTTASSDNSVSSSGAAYIFKRTGTTWAQEAYLKASNAEAGDAFFRVGISRDTLVIGASGEDSNQTTITNGATSSSDNSALSSGAVYIYQR